MNKNFCLLCDDGEQISQIAPLGHMVMSAGRAMPYDNRFFVCNFCSAKYWYDMDGSLAEIAHGTIPVRHRGFTVIPDGTLCVMKDKRV